MDTCVHVHTVICILVINYLLIHLLQSIVYTRDIDCDHHESVDVIS